MPEVLSIGRGAGADVDGDDGARTKTGRCCRRTLRSPRRRSSSAASTGSRISTRRRRWRRASPVLLSVASRCGRCACLPSRRGRSRRSAEGDRARLREERGRIRATWTRFVGATSRRSCWLSEIAYRQARALVSNAADPRFLNPRLAAVARPGSTSRRAARVSCGDTARAPEILMFGLRSMLIISVARVRSGRVRRMRASSDCTGLVFSVC